MSIVQMWVSGLVPQIRNPKARHSVGTGKMMFKPAHGGANSHSWVLGSGAVEQPRLKVEVFKESVDMCCLEAWNWTGSPT